ncbi:MAG: MerR family transcriptional regulator [Pseudomonadota bacterium]
MSKSRDAFRTISEVADWLGTQAHVLRFWESKFSQVKPVKRAGGRRYYRPSDMMLLGGIKKLLHDDGLTIKGVQKILRERGVKYVASLSPAIDDVAIPGPKSNVVPIERRPEAGPEGGQDVIDGVATEVADDAGASEIAAAADTPDKQVETPGEAATPVADAPEAPMAEDVTPEFSFEEIVPLETAATSPKPAAETPETVQAAVSDTAAEESAGNSLAPAQENALRIKALLRSPRVRRQLDADALAPLVARLQALRDRMASDARR